MVTAVVFSAIDAAAVSPPLFDVIVGSSPRSGCHRDGNGLGIDSAVAVRDLHRDVIDIVATDSVGVSKSGAVKKRARPFASIVNFEARPAIDRIDQRLPGSGSVAVTVVTAVVFSATETAAVFPPPFDAIVGGLFPGLPPALYTAIALRRLLSTNVLRSTSRVPSLTVTVSVRVSVELSAGARARRD